MAPPPPPPAPQIAPPPAGAPDGSKVELSSGALIIYTSGTTGRPKGALHTHQGISAQVHSLCSAWEWAEGDRIVHPLPMHHIHGIVNAWLCAHRSGAAVEFVPKFRRGGGQRVGGWIGRPGRSPYSRIARRPTT